MGCAFQQWEAQLKEGSSGAVVQSLQTLLTNGALDEWGTTPQGIDGTFGPHTKASVEAFQRWGGVTADGIVGDQTWSVSLHAASATLESAVSISSSIEIARTITVCRAPVPCYDTSAPAGRRLPYSGRADRY
jgi:peptidoglycan hydrolase-like protein with peptidoglycan-binding domain